MCIPVPFYHCFGMVLGNLARTTHGSAMVIPAAGFNPAATLHAVASERCTSLYGVPTVPRHIRLTDTFPMTITGKVRKFRMREQSITELGLDEAARMRSA